jgi:hypothetical protein
MRDRITFEERVIQECDRWLEGEADAAVTEPTDFYAALIQIKAALIDVTNTHAVERAIVEYTRYVGLVPEDQRTRYDASWRESRKIDSSRTPVQPFSLNLA